jgi:hypothetical protein
MSPELPCPGGSSPAVPPADVDIGRRTGGTDEKEVEEAEMVPDANAGAAEHPLVRDVVGEALLSASVT